MPEKPAFWPVFGAKSDPLAGNTGKFGGWKNGHADANMAAT
jgi:hypothetical protein